MSNDSTPKFKLGDKVILAKEFYVLDILTVVSDVMDFDGSKLYNLEAYSYYTDADEADLRHATAEEIAKGCRQIEVPA